VNAVAEQIETERTASERREEWRAGYDSGLKHGAARYFNSPLMEQLALELTLLRATAESLGKQADFWRAKFLDAVHVIANPRVRS
jgi:DNA polymerase III psi subunit